MTRVAHADGVEHLARELRPELADHEHVDRVLEIGERLLLRRRRGRGLVVTRRSWSSMRYFLLKRNKDLEGRPERRRCRRNRLCAVGAVGDEDVCEVVERGRGIRLRARQDDRDSLVDRPRDLAVGGDEDVRLASEHRDDVVLADPDAGVGPVQDELDLLRVVIHETEGLEPELGVLERERVERADHHEVGARVDRGDDLGREAGRRVGDDVVVARPRDDQNVAEQLDRDRARLVGPRRREQHIDARIVGHDVVRKLVLVERAA